MTETGVLLITDLVMLTCERLSPSAITAAHVFLFSLKQSITSKMVAFNLKADSLVGQGTNSSCNSLTHFASKLISLFQQSDKVNGTEEFAVLVSPLLL